MENWLNAMKSPHKALFFRQLGALGGKVLLFFLPKHSVTLSVVFLESRRVRNYVVGPCHHGMARPQVADRGTASDKEGSCE